MAKLHAYTPLLITVFLLIAAAATYGVVNSQSGREIDTDGDGLIEVSNLEQLDAIRYDLDGDGQADAESGRDTYAAAFPLSVSERVCRTNCNGYELARPLDFDDADSYTSGTVNAKWTSGDGWLPIGNYNNRFGATFSGNGRTISNLYINRATQFNDPGATGLFGVVSGRIKDLGLIDVDVTGIESVGGLAGNAQETIGSYATGSVSGNKFVGGLVGQIQGRDSTVTNSYANGNVSGSTVIGGLIGYNRGGTVSGSYAAGTVMGEEFNIGGLIGGNTGMISSSYATGVVMGDTSIGGLTGANSQFGGTISASYATGSVSGDSSVGGLAGSGGGTISASYATGSVSGDSSVGGLVGSESGTISASYATGSVSGESSVGGLVGSGGGTISASYATGDVSGNEGIGGLAGRANTILISYATGRVSGTGEEIGGLVGGDAEGNINVIGGYWNTQTSGQRTSAAGEGKTTAELQSPTGYTGVYAAWHIDVDNSDQDFDQSTGVDDIWDFGTSSQYPAVRADFNGDGKHTWQEFGNQRGQSSAPTPRPTAATAQTPSAGTADANARPSSEVFEELVEAGLLVSVWSYHNASQSWDAYDPNVPNELNDLTHAAPKDIVWVEVTETTRFQGRTLHKGWNLISLE